MIAGATRGAGGRALSRHLASEQNEAVIIGPSRGLVSAPEDIHAKLRELEETAAHGRTARPLHHVHCDPPADAADEAAVRATFWDRYEREFGLEKQPFLSVIHEKHGRRHEHRVYSLVHADGSVVNLSHDYARREKVSRLTEMEHGLTLTAGRHNRAVAAALEHEDRHDVAQAMTAAGMLGVTRPEATSPAARHQAERTGIMKEAVGMAALAAWRASDNGPAFEAALAESGLRLAQGTKTVQIIDQTGGTHDLRRTLSQASKASGGEPVKSADISNRLSSVTLPIVQEAKQSVRDAAAPAMPAAPRAPAQQQARPTGKPSSTAAAKPSGGSPTPAATGDVEAGPAPLDPSRPDDVSRFLREWGQWWERRQAKAAAVAREIQQHEQAQQKEPDHGDAGEKFFEWLREALSRPEAQTPRVERQHGLGDDGRDHGRREAEKLPLDTGLKGDDSARLRGIEDGPEDGRPDAVARLAQASGEAGGEQNRPDNRASTAGGRSADPARTEASRARIASRRASRALAAAVPSDRLSGLADRLRDGPPSAAFLAQEAINDASRRIYGVLRHEPPALDSDRMQADARHRVYEAMRDRDRTHDVAQERLAKAEVRVGWLDRVLAQLGFPSAEWRELRDAQAASEHASSRTWDRGEVVAQTTAAERQARQEVAERQQERDRFARRPDVVKARRDMQALHLVQAAVQRGDRILIALAAIDMKAAQDEAIRREAEERRKREEEFRRMQKQAQRRAPAPSGPSFRMR